jgi:S1-C subfamily serine protease
VLAVVVVVLVSLIAATIGYGLGHLHASKTVRVTIPHRLPFGNGSNGFGPPNGYGPYVVPGPGRASSGSVSKAPGAPSNIPSIVSAISPGLVDINVTQAYGNGQGAGTGMVITPSGEVLTNNHVIEGAGQITATDLGNGKAYQATVVGYDRSHDVAVLQLKGASGLKTVPVGDSSTAAVGQAIVAIGNAGGAGGKPSAAGGSITALHHAIVANGAGGPERLGGLIEVNAALRSGDSGGALANASGKAIGMNAAASIGNEFRQGAGHGFAIPINEALAIAKQIESGVPTSTVHIGQTAFLGVSLAPTPTAGSRSGASITGVLSGTAASHTALKAGDTITSFGGKTVTTGAALRTLIAAHRPGDRVQVTWVDKAGGRHTATVTLSAGPPS